MSSNYLIFKQETNDWLDDKITLRVEVPKETDAVYVAKACYTFMTALGYSENIIEKYFNTDAIYDDFYDVGIGENAGLTMPSRSLPGRDISVRN